MTTSRASGTVTIAAEMERLAVYFRGGKQPNPHSAHPSSHIDGRARSRVAQAASGLGGWPRARVKMRHGADGQLPVRPRAFEARSDATLRKPVTFVRAQNYASFRRDLA